MVSLIGGNKLQIQPNRFSQFYQRHGKFTVMVVGWGQQRDQRHTMTTVGVDCSQSMHSITNHVNGFISFTTSFAAITIYVSVYPDLLFSDFYFRQ